MNKVLSTTEFVLQRLEHHKGDLAIIGGKEEIYRAYHSEECENYAQLMQQPLELGMFTPCVDGKPIEEPKKQFTGTTKEGAFLYDDGNKKKYQQAKEQVLFEGATIELYEKPVLVWIDDYCVGKFYRNQEMKETIEDLARQIDLKPTKAFLDKIGLESLADDKKPSGVLKK